MLVILNDRWEVNQGVLGKGLNKCNWVLELFTPCGDLFDVTLNVFALLEVLGKFIDELSNFLDSLYCVYDVSFVEVFDNLG